MSDKRKILAIIIIVFAFYWIYYSQDAIRAFIRKDADEITTTEKVRVQVIGEEDAVIKVVEDSSPAVVSIVSKGVYSENSIGTGFIVDGTN